MIRSIPVYTFIILSVFSGCRPGSVEVVAETDEKQYQLAKKYQSQGQLADALNAYLRVIDARRGNAPESHLEAGYIYLKVLKDSVRAIYHFERYLEQEPAAPQARTVRQLIETAQKEFARQLPAQPYEGELDRIDMMELVNSLKQENNRLKRELLATQQQLQRLENAPRSASRLAPSGTTANTSRPSYTYGQSQSSSTSPDPGSVPRTYTVQSGDSLSSISRMMYGTPSRWIDIYQANRDQLSSENALKVGQELRIP